MPGGDRKLAAIMFTDVVGFTALSQEDERGAIALLEKHNELLRPILSTYHGREVKTIGDSFLVEFDSALEATECALEIQDRLKAFNGEARPPRALEVRIGIHVGDVIVQDGDVFGDAVNLASRVQPLADPGGICISEQVYAQVRNKVLADFSLMPPQTLKNVRFAMNIYKVTGQSKGRTGLESDQAVSRTRIAVLPFTNISHDQTDEYFAEGVTEELITAISQVHDLKVIARTSTARYKGTSKSVAEIGRELGVGSVLEGSTRMAGNKVRVTAQLIDTSNEEHIWANNYDRQLDDIFSIQSEIAKSVSEALEVKLLTGEAKKLDKKPTGSSIAFVKYLKGRAALHNRREEDLQEAKRRFEEAIADDADFAMAYVGLADAYFLLGEYYSVPMGEALAKSEASLSKALSIDPDLPEGHVALANLLQHEYRFHEAVREYESALEANPNYAQGHHWFAICLWDMGRYERALGEIKKAEDLDPLSAVIGFNAAFAEAVHGDRSEALKMTSKLREIEPEGRYADGAMSYIEEMDRNFASAISILERLTKVDPKDRVSLGRLGRDYGLAGETKKALEVLEAFESRKEEREFGLMGIVYGGLGERDKMFECFEKAYANRSLVYRGLWFDAPLLGIGGDPRFRSLMSRVGLDPDKPPKLPG